MAKSLEKIDRTVDEYLANFRSAAMALAPAYEYIGLNWQDPHAYDEWDDVLRLLYKTIVADELIVEEDRERYFPLVSYGHAGRKYGELSYIHVGGERNRAFVSFETDTRPFETVLLLRINADGTPGRTETQEWKGLSFALRANKRP